MSNPQPQPNPPLLPACPNCASPLEAVTGCCRDTTCGESPDYDESLPDLTPPPVDSPLDLAQFDGHTPGPWCVAPCHLFSPDSEAYKGHKYGMDVISGTEQPTWDKYADQGEGELHYPEGAERICSTSDANGLANAQLIAAAPSLLALCMRLSASEARLRDENARLRAALEKTAHDLLVWQAGSDRLSLDEIKEEAARAALSCAPAGEVD